MTDKPHQCSLCKREFFSLEELDLHTRRKHSDMIINPSDEVRTAGYTRKFVVDGEVSSTSEDDEE